MSGFNVKANSNMGLLLHQVTVRFGAPVAEELPDVPHFLDLVEIQIRDDHFLLVAGSFGDDLSARRAEIALAVEFANVPRMLASDAIDRADKISVRDGVSRLLQLPEVFTQTCNRCRGIEHDFGSVQTKGPRAFRKVTIVTDVNTDVGELRLENGKTEIA